MANEDPIEAWTRMPSRISLTAMPTSISDHRVRVHVEEATRELARHQFTIRTVAPLDGPAICAALVEWAMERKVAIDVRERDWGGGRQVIGRILS